MKKKLLGIFSRHGKNEDKEALSLNLKIYVNKPERRDGKYTPPMIILTRKKAGMLRGEISKALSGKKEYIRIDITGELNPKEEKGKDYSFIAMEEMKAEE